MEQKYFISYVACTEASTRQIILNDFIYTYEPMDRELIEKLEISLVERLNEIKHEDGEDLESKYYSAQIINFIKIEK